MENKFGLSARKGFTLLEVLIAIVVATIGLISLSMLLLHATKYNGVASNYTRATFLAQDMIERIKDGNIVENGTFGFMKMSDVSTGIVQDSGILSGINEKGEVGGPFTIQWHVFTHTDWSRRVAVDVSWHSLLGMTRTVRFASVSRGGGN